MGMGMGGNGNAASHSRTSLLLESLYIQLESRHVVCPLACLTGRCGCGGTADKLMSVEGCRVVQSSVHGIPSPLSRAGGVHVARAGVTIACMSQIQCQATIVRLLSNKTAIVGTHTFPVTVSIDSLRFVQVCLCHIGSRLF